MSTVELRHIITEYLSHIEDIPFLNALKTILEYKVTEGNYKLSDYQIKRVEEARKQLREGQIISHEDMQKEIGQWLSSK